MIQHRMALTRKRIVSNIILRHPNGTICMYESGAYYIVDTDGTRKQVSSKLDIFPLTPTKHKPKARRRKKL